MVILCWSFSCQQMSLRAAANQVLCLVSLSFRTTFCRLFVTCLPACISCRQRPWGIYQLTGNLLSTKELPTADVACHKHQVIRHDDSHLLSPTSLVNKQPTHQSDVPDRSSHLVAICKQAHSWVLPITRP